MTNRRSFLCALAGAATAFSMDPERLLWRHGAKLISIPKPPRLFRMSLFPSPPDSVRMMLCMDGVPYEAVSAYQFPILVGTKLSVRFTGAVRDLPTVLFEEIQ